MIVMAVTDPAKGSRGGITAFLVDRGTPGMSIPTVLNGYDRRACAPSGVYFDNVEVPESQVLGEIGKGFGPDAEPARMRRRKSPRAR